MTRREQIKQYNIDNPGYNITAVKKFYGKPQDLSSVWSSKSLYELYQKPSDAKIESWEEILRTYQPREILSVQGSVHTYSVHLIASNGDVLHITRSNNYLLEVTPR